LTTSLEAHAKAVKLQGIQAQLLAQTKTSMLWAAPNSSRNRHLELTSLHALSLPTTQVDQQAQGLFHMVGPLAKMDGYLV